MKATIQIHKELQEAYDFFNKQLFKQELPDVLMTLQRGKRTFGYFSPERFSSESGSTIAELAMNPDYFGSRTLIDTLSTVVHEMVHVWQHYISPKKTRMGYHDKVWGDKMEELGLMPSNTGLPNGKRVGQQMSHYIIDNGLFAKTVFELIKSGYNISWYDSYGAAISVRARVSTTLLDDWTKQAENDDKLIERLTLTVSKGQSIIDDPDNNHSIDIKPPIKNNSNRIKYSCPGCSVNAWAKAGINLQCADCNLALTASA